MKYEDFIKKCNDPQNICQAFEANSTINPLTSRKINKTGAIYKNLTKLCTTIKKLTLHDAPITHQDSYDRITYMNKVKKILASLNLNRWNYCISQPTSELNKIFEKISLINVGGFGKIYRVTHNNLTFILKETLLEDEDRSVIKEKHFDDIAWDQWYKAYPLEIYALKLTNRLIENNESPHFIYSAGGGLCKDCALTTLNYSNKIGHCYVAALELAEFTLADVLNDLPVEYIKVAIQQLLLGLAVLHAKYGLVHGDLKGDNILVTKIRPGGYIKYNLFGRSFYVKNIGLLFMITDYNVSKIYHEAFSLTKYRGNKYFKAVATELPSGWGEKAGQEYSLTPFSTKKFLSFNKQHKLSVVDNTYLRTWYNEKNVKIGRFTINRFAKGINVEPSMKVTVHDMRAFPEFTFYADIQDILLTFKGGNAISQSFYHHAYIKPLPFLTADVFITQRNKWIYKTTNAKYFFADVMAAYLFPECQIQQPYKVKYVYVH